jgi:hypothetical protein
MFYGVNIAEEVVGEGVKKYHNSQCRGTPGGLFEQTSTAEVSELTEYQLLN